MPQIAVTANVRFELGTIAILRHICGGFGFFPGVESQFILTRQFGWFINLHIPMVTNIRLLVSSASAPNKKAPTFVDAFLVELAGTPFLCYNYAYEKLRNLSKKF